uniref:Putative secreted protein n=1 Tax=Amblyomma parvum TaxID=251391 RepID=A0A023FZG7_AMBPA
MRDTAGISRMKFLASLTFLVAVLSECACESGKAKKSTKPDQSEPAKVAHTFNLLGQSGPLVMVHGNEATLKLHDYRCWKTNYTGVHNRQLRIQMEYKPQRTHEGLVNWMAKHFTILVEVTVSSSIATVYIFPYGTEQLPLPVSGNHRILYAEENCFVLRHQAPFAGCSVWAPILMADQPPTGCTSVYRSMCLNSKDLDYRPWRGLCGFGDCKNCDPQ